MYISLIFTKLFCIDVGTVYFTYIYDTVLYWCRNCSVHLYIRYCFVLM